MKTVAYSCPFVPAEWIAAHGWRPSRIVPTGVFDPAAGGISAGLCPYAHAFAQTVIRANDCDAVVVTTLCDPMRRVYERIARDCKKPAFLLNVPSTWQSEASRSYYASELRRLGRFLIQFGGVEPSPDRLADIMQKSDSTRKAIRSYRERCSAREFSQAIMEWNKTGLVRNDPPLDETRERGIPIALLGSPMLGKDMAVFDVVKQSGGCVVLDGTETGERGWPDAFDPDSIQRDPFQELIRAYFDTIPDASRRPNDLLYQWLKRNIQQRGARGLIVLHYTWCDPWQAEIRRIQSTFGILTLGIQLDAAGYEINARNVLRIQTLLDVLR